MNFWLVAGLLAIGYVVCWFTKDWAASFFISTETQIRAFENKIKSLKAKF